MYMPSFTRLWILFIPLNTAAWLLFIISAAYSIYIFFDIDSRSHSVSDTLINFVFNLVIIWVIYSVIAYISGKLFKKFKDF
ncbi:MAG: hypothetical protein IPL55_16465 [Saprospiraceae bacterium]|nr:hypothetical protein [Saprospiraceae bacterium]